MTTEAIAPFHKPRVGFWVCEAHDTPVKLMNSLEVSEHRRAEKCLAEAIVFECVTHGREEP